MRLRTFSSIGGLRLFGNPLSPREPGFNNRQDFLDIKVAREDISPMAVGLIQEIGADASEELIAKCRELVTFADEHLVVQKDEKGFTPDQRAFVKRCEDNAGESMRLGETPEQYYTRLVHDYK